eukprot:10957981-Ditylum_brightwellii.AAC.2
MLIQVQQKNFDVKWTPGQKNLVDYPTKHHTGKYHQHVHPFYVHMHNSPRFLPQAPAPHVLQGCVNSSGKNRRTYNKQMPLL